MIIMLYKLWLSCNTYFDKCAKCAKCYSVKHTKQLNVNRLICLTLLLEGKSTLSFTASTKYEKIQVKSFKVLKINGK